MLDICPTSNVLLSVTPTLEKHPLPALLRVGVACTINADDPLLFDTNLLREYEHCRNIMKLSDSQLASIASTSVQASSAPTKIVAKTLRDIEVWLRN